jgi:DUF971 family protein
MAAEHWPTEMRLRNAGRQLRITFEDARFDLSAEYLRVSSPSAEVQGHSAAERKTVGGKRHVAISAIEPVGHYAVKLVFGDGHDTGLYTWDYLYELGSSFEAKWAAYLTELDAKRLSRG